MSYLSCLSCLFVLLVQVSDDAFDRLVAVAAISHLFHATFTDFVIERFPGLIVTRPMSGAQPFFDSGHELLRMRRPMSLLIVAGYLAVEAHLTVAAYSQIGP